MAPTMQAGSRPAYHQAGYAYVLVLAALAIFGIGLAALGESWSAVSRREREEELLQVGSAYARAIEQYYLRSPGGQRRYPTSLMELADDRRFVGTVRYLRRVYADPIARSMRWGIVAAPDGGIMGVYSLSEERVLRQQPFAIAPGWTVGGPRYSDWKFVYRPDIGAIKPL